jgi:hypothetical protein
VRQTVAMVRDHEHEYEVGPGYQQHADGSVTERYWLRTGARCAATRHDSGGPDGVNGNSCAALQPYQIELIGVTCDPKLAVARGIWRKLRTGRAVPVAAQLRSFRLFAQAWPAYCKMMDSATLYHTGDSLRCHASSVCHVVCLSYALLAVSALRRQFLAVDMLHLTFPFVAMLAAHAAQCRNEASLRRVAQVRSSQR